VDNKLELLGSDVRQVALDLVENMVSRQDAQLITVYYGSDVSEEDAQSLFDEITEKYPDCDTDIQRGGQPLYYYLIAVE